MIFTQDFSLKGFLGFFEPAEQLDFPFG